MKGVVHDRYGPPEVLRIEEVPVPSPGPRQVLVEVVATSINLSDWEGLRGAPSYARIGGLRVPRRRMLGSDIAGRVAAVGDEVTRFSAGDVVYGDNLQLKGGFAEYALAPEAVLAHKPGGLTYAQAPTLPQAGAIAWQGTAGVAAGQRVLVNGAGGGAGMFAIQLAKQAGAHVTGIDNARKLAFMKSMGLARLATTAVRTSPTTRRSTTSWTWSPPDHRSPISGRWHPVAATSASAELCTACCRC